VTDAAADPPSGRPGVESRAGRRTVLLAGCAGLAALGAAACAEYGSGGPAATPPSPAPPSPAPPSPAPPSPAPPSPATPSPAGGTSVSGGTVPVGGGVVLADRGVVVTQPVAGTFAAFDTTCPHQGCSVDTVADGTINCPCHGSRFHVADGSVAQGPAARGLTSRSVQVADGRVTVT
jgi:Rieske Fe-S protein